MADKSLTDKLCNASANGNLCEVLFLLQNGADVNGFNTYKRTALQVGIVFLQICLCQVESSKMFVFMKCVLCNLAVHCDLTSSLFDFLILLSCGAGYEALSYITIRWLCTLLFKSKKSK